MPNQRKTYKKPLEVRDIPIKDLKPAKYNPRKIDDDEYNTLVESIKGFGQRENLIVNKDMTVISGHMRLLALKELGYKEVACDVVNLNKADEKKLNLIMNSPKMQGRFDLPKVDKIIDELKVTEDDLDLYKLPELGSLDTTDNADEQKQTACHNCPIHCSPALENEGK